MMGIQDVSRGMREITKAPSAPRRPRNFAPAAESLEGRTLLSAGDLDPTFGSGGSGAIVVDNGFNFQEVNAIAIDGNELVLGGNFAGNSLPFSQVALYSLNGAPEKLIALPTAFLTGMFSSLQGQSGRQGVSGVAIQGDGKIVVVGSLGDEIGIARLNADGSLDTSFGEKQMMLSPLDAVESATGVVIQPDGKIDVVGTYTNIVNGNGMFISDVFRLNTDGSLDRSFGNNGVASLDFSNANVATNITSIALDGNDIMLAGTVAGPNFANAHVVVFDLTPAGALNNSFGTSGAAATGLPNIGGPVTAVIQPGSGNVLVATTSNAQFAMLDYQRNGQIDQTFGMGGAATIGFAGDSAVAENLALEPDGSIVVVGYAKENGYGNYALTRLLPSGAVDGNFGYRGEVQTTAFAFSPVIPADWEVAQALVIENGGDIVVGGYAGFDGNYTDLALARYQGTASAPPPSGSQPGSTSNGGWMPNGGTGQSNTPPPTPPAAIRVAGFSQNRKGITTVTVAFNEPLNPASAMNTGFYGLALGVKKRRRLVFSKPVFIRSAYYNGNSESVTITLAKPTRGTIQMTVYNGIQGSNGAVSASPFSAIF